MTPERSAASCRRREAVRPSVPLNSPTTPARARWCSASSTTEQHGRGLAGVHVDDPRRSEADGGERGGVQVAPLQDPQHVAGQAGEQGGGEQGGGGAMLDLGAAAGDLVQGAPGQAAAGQGRVDGGQAEGEGAGMGGAGPPLQPGHLRPGAPRGRRAERCRLRS